MLKKILTAKHRGFCAGVERAVEIVEKSLIKYGAPVYVRHEIVHNKFVVNKKRESSSLSRLMKFPKKQINQSFFLLMVLQKGLLKKQKTTIYFFMMLFALW